MIIISSCQANHVLCTTPASSALTREGYFTGFSIVSNADGTEQGCGRAKTLQGFLRGLQVSSGCAMNDDVSWRNRLCLQAHVSNYLINMFEMSRISKC
jgi:hypothetical protein